MKTEIIDVKSSFIEDIQYNVDAQRLKVIIGNIAYFYYGVTKQKVARLKRATSKGNYFCRYIKGKYKMIKRRIK